ncbi:MAG TPA: SDR family NAD(P)-dependent oxidoreductase [Caulobacterales bacterium]|nr:SDR family NAD(P)-dependent oxidoreductase [Caulobacterales bacterium]
MQFDGQSVIIAGAAGNLGSAVARELAARGADLTLAGATQAPLEALAASLTTKTAPLTVAADARTKEGCERIAAAATDRFGRIDALANTVGTFRTAPIAGGAAGDLWSELMTLNTLSALHLSAAVIPAMKARGYGRIVHTSAGAGLKAFAGASIYAASKAALMRITEALAEEHARDGVTANCVLPGTIDTPQNRAAMPKADPSKWTKPEAIAKVIAFLVSNEAGGVTGAAIPVTGHG